MSDNFADTFNKVQNLPDSVTGTFSSSKDIAQGRNMNDTPADMMKKQTRVYVVNLGEREFDLSESYGEPIYLTQGFVQLYDIAILKDRIKKQLKHATKEDFLLLSGNNLLCVIVSETWKELFGFVNILHYDPKKGGSYRVIKI
jgi:hypothetical protein